MPRSAPLQVIWMYGRRPPGPRSSADPVQTARRSASSVDEETEAHLGWKPARRSVGREDEPELFQVRHHVADGGRRQRNRQQALQISRTDRLAGRQITLDDLTENLARTLVERR